MQMMKNTFSGPLSTVLASMLSELYAVEVLFYAESLGVVTPGHATEMAVTPFDPQLLKTPRCRPTQTSLLYLLQCESKKVAP